MTKQALRELRGKVAAGEHWHFSQFEPPELPLTWIDAFNGSLDAAVAFLEAVLPEFAIDRISKWPGENATVELLGTHEDDGERWHRHSDGRFKAEADTPARALLLATLDALIARAE